jgi:hypothetical protein
MSFVIRLPHTTTMVASCVAGLLLLVCLFRVPAAQAHEPDGGQCKATSINRSQVLPDVMFDTRLSPFGEVCFLGRHQPVPDDPDHSTVIGFELWHDGALVYRLPQPDDGLWPPACDKVRAVAFPAHGDVRDIIVIGNCLGASDEQPQPLVYRAGPGGFTLDSVLSTDLIGVDTVKKVEQRMRTAAPKS